MTNQPESIQSSPKKLLVSTLIAVVVAVLVLFIIVLPAEYDIDPLRTGQLLGLSSLQTQQADVINHQAEAYRSDRYVFILSPFESLEYKYRLEEGAAMLYNWDAEGDLVFDFHAEPDGSPEDYAESFDQGQSAAERGSYTATFSGIHGWFWENRGDSDVRVELNTSGFYSHSIEFRDGFQNKKELN